MSNISSDAYYVLSTSLKLLKIQTTQYPPPKFLIKSFSSKDRLSLSSRHIMTGRKGLRAPRCDAAHGSAGDGCQGFTHWPGPERLLFMNCLFTKQVHHCQRHKTERMLTVREQSNLKGRPAFQLMYDQQWCLNSLVSHIKLKDDPAEQVHVFTWLSTGVRLAHTQEEGMR